MYLKYGMLDLLVDNKECSGPQLHLQFFKLFRTPFRAKSVLSVVSTMNQQDILETRYFHDFNVCPDGFAFLIVEASIQGYGTRSVKD